MKNKFYYEVQEAYQKKFSKQELNKLLGKGRAKKGMFLGDLEDGELEIGQISGIINEIKPASEIIKDILNEFYLSKKEAQKIIF